MSKISSILQLRLVEGFTKAELINAFALTMEECRYIVENVDIDLQVYYTFMVLGQMILQILDRQDDYIGDCIKYLFDKHNIHIPKNIDFFMGVIKPRIESISSKKVKKINDIYKKKELEWIPK